MKRMKNVMLCVLALAMAGSVYAGTYSGPAYGGTRDWSLGTSWFDGVPTLADTALLYVGGTANYAVISTAAIANEVYIGGYIDASTSNCRLDMIGGSLTTAGSMVLGVNSNRYGEFNQSAGVAALGGHLYLALSPGTSGTANLSGTAALSCNVLVMGYGTTPLAMQLNISGNATLSASDISLNRDGTALITISDNGKLILAGDRPWFAGDNVYYGGLKAGPGQTITSSYDFLNDKTTVYAIPEPMTLALLGLGGLFAARRKV